VSPDAAPRAPHRRPLRWRIRLAMRDARYLTAAGVVVLVLLAVALVSLLLPGSDVTAAVERADLANKILTSLGVFAAGIWALFTFVIFRTGVTNLEMTLTTDVLPYRDELRLVIVTVALKNVGKVRVTPGESGCRMWVRQLSTDEPAGSTLDLDRGEVLVDSHDLIGRYDPASPYEIEPGTQYNEIGTVVAAAGDVLGVKVTFFLGDRIDDAISESRVVRVD
jgi:hypothetical protein